MVLKTYSLSLCCAKEALISLSLLALVISTHIGCDYFTGPGEKAAEFSTDVVKQC